MTTRGMLKRDPLKHRTVLVVEDDLLLRKRVTSLLLQEEAQVISVATLAEARAAVRKDDYDLVLLDINLPDGNGLDLLRESVLPESTSAVVMTADGGIESAISALQCGAADFLVKPFDPFAIPLVYARCRERKEARRRREHERQPAGGGAAGFFQSAGLRTVEERLERILEMDRRLEENLPPVLIIGETGTGKSLLARRLHDLGPRGDKPFVQINCAALPENLIESELFGNERGAFTAAREARMGLFEAAGGGTLFLDEIPGLPPPAQAKMLTALERRTIRRVGGTREIEVDVRVVGASLVDLERLVAAGRFRPDLYHRLHVLQISLPSLRERREDILPLAEHLLQQLKKRYGLQDAQISPRGAQRLRTYDWPGNVRELVHELERSLILTGDEPLDFPALVSRAAAAPATEGDWLAPGWRLPDAGFSLENAERRLIRLALDHSGGNVSAAARRLGVSRDYIRYRLRKAAAPEATPGEAPGD